MCDNFLDNMFDFNGDGCVSDFERDTGYLMYTDMINNELDRDSDEDFDSDFSDFDCDGDF